MNSAALGSVLQVIQYVILAGSILTAGKLWTTGLYRNYPVFFAYFLFRIPNSLWPLFIDVRSRTYFNFWRFTEVLALLFYVLLAAELYRLVFDKYRGLQTVGRWAMYLSLAISVAISTVSLMAQFGPKTSSRDMSLKIVLAAQTTVDTALTIFILLLLAVLSFYPIRLSPNVRLHALVYSLFFFSNTVGSLLRSLFGLRVSETLSLGLSAVNVICMLVWLFRLNRAGDAIPALEQRIETAQEKRLLAQLDALNATMLRVSRQHAR